MERKVFVADLSIKYMELSPQMITYLGVPPALKLLMTIRNVDECWDYQGAITGYGYGTMTINYKNEQAHRLSYQLFQGDLDPDLTIDHLCENKACVNPFHLEQITAAENTRRWYKNRKMCKNGLHELTEDNLIIFEEGRSSRGRALCRECRELSVLNGGQDRMFEESWISFNNETDTPGLDFRTMSEDKFMNKYQGNPDLIRERKAATIRKATIIRECRKYQVDLPDNLDEMIKSPAACKEFYKKIKNENSTNIESRRLLEESLA